MDHACRFGPVTWPLVYPSDERYRLENLERLKRTLERDAAAAEARSQAPAIAFEEAVEFCLGGCSQ